MVTSKRRASQDTVRDYEPTAAPVKGRSNVTFNDDLMMMRSYVENPSETVTAPTEPAYKQAEREEVISYNAPAPAKKAVRVADIMPVISTKRTASAAKEDKQEKVAVNREKTLSPSMKKALIAYLSIVVILTIAVIATGVAINSASAEIFNNEAAASELTQTIALQEAELDKLSDPERLGEMAAQLGMTNVTSSINIQLVPVREKTITSVTNWFDAFCDWIGSIFGG